jgi:TolA-binding protein
MGAVTYPHAQVASLVNASFVPIKINIKEPPKEANEVLRMVKPLWAPTFAYLDPSRIELRRGVGYRPPLEFLAEMNFVLAMAHQLHGRYAEALDKFKSVAAQYEETSVAPEALFWAGAAAYRSGGGLEALKPYWKEIEERYGDTVWRDRAAVLD